MAALGSRESQQRAEVARLRGLLQEALDVIHGRLSIDDYGWTAEDADLLRRIDDALVKDVLAAKKEG